MPLKYTHIMRLKLIFIALAMVQASLCFSQLTYSDTELFDEGIYFLNRNDYKEAVFYFKSLVERFPDNAHYNFLTGECYLNMENQEHLAIPYFEVAIKSIVPKKEFRRRAFDESNAPLHAYFYLGNAYRYAGRLDDALKVYDTFINSPYYPYNYNDNVVGNEIQSCERAALLQKDKKNITVEFLPSIINTDASESRPIISTDGKTLVFIRTLKFYDAIYCTVKDEDGNWIEPYNITSQIQSDGNFYPVCLNDDGTKMLLTSDALGTNDLFVSRLQNNKWQPAEQLCNKICSNGKETSACFGISTDEVYFTSDRHGGKGGQDIYMIIYDRVKLKWGKPELVDELSSEFDEESVKFCKTCNTMFFSSKGFNNMGGYDIFSSRLIEGKWEVPVNMGYPINTTRNNVGFQPMPDCKSGLIALPDSISGVETDIALIRIEP